MSLCLVAQKVYHHNYEYYANSRGFFVAFHFSSIGNVVALSFKFDAFEVKEMGVLMLDLDLKGRKLCGKALLNFGLI
jgi:hypothetical protein